MPADPIQRGLFVSRVRKFKDVISMVVITHHPLVLRKIDIDSNIWSVNVYVPVLLLDILRHPILIIRIPVLQVQRIGSCIKRRDLIEI